MPSVLKRTNLKPSTENFLLPIYECISNSIYSIQERWADKFIEKGIIQVELTTASFSSIIIDNGIGLNDDNYEKFKTPFANHKLKKGGKGFGRFIGFKVFEKISYSSAYSNGSDTEYRNFDFDIYRDNEIGDPKTPTTHEFDYGCTVRYENVLPPFSKIASTVKAENIIEHIIRYFLPFFINGKIPKFEIVIDGVKFDAREKFSGFFTTHLQKSVALEIEGESHEIDVQISKVNRNKLFQNHSMLMFADGRIIGTGRDITGKIGKAYFENSSGEKHIYIASVSGSYFDENANTARTQIEMDPKDIDQVVNIISKMILEEEAEYVKKHRKQQAKGVMNAIARNPMLRSALRGQTISQYVDNQQMSWKSENFVSDLALKRYRDQRDWERVLEESLATPERLAEKRDEILEHITNDNRDALASYVAHRKSIIQLAEKTFELQETGKMSLEDIFHDLVHPRYQDSDSTKFYQHNLWLLDEKLSFFSHISSDRSNLGGSRKKGDKVADLIFFDDCSIYREGDNDVIVLVEFKRPGRNNYKYGDAKNDPISQVIDTGNKIREDGKIITTKQRTISVPKGVRIYAYVIADIEKTLKAVCENNDMRSTWDNEGYYRYHERKDIFIEVLSYDKLLKDAKKRNAAFFDILLGDLVD